MCPRLSQYLDALTCCACTCDWYAYACNTHVQARDYRRNVCTMLRAIRHIPGVHRIRFGFVVGATNFRREWSVLCINVVTNSALWFWIWHLLNCEYLQYLSFSINISHLSFFLFIFPSSFLLYIYKIFDTLIASIRKLLETHLDTRRKFNFNEICKSIQRSWINSIPESLYQNILSVQIAR